MAFIRGYQPRDKEDCAFICRETLPASLAQAHPRVQLLAPYVWTHQFTYLSPSTCHVLDDGEGKVVGYCIGCPDVFAMARVYDRFVRDVLMKDEGVASSNGVGGGPETTGWIQGPRVPWDVPALSTREEKDPGRVGGEEKTTTNPRALEQLAFRADLLLKHPAPSSPSLLLNTRRQDGSAHPELPSYRATMHIDLLPEFQGQGWGRKLIDTFVQSVATAVDGDGGGGGGASGGEEGGEQDYGSGIWIGVSPENRKVLPFYERLGFRLVMNDDAEGVVLVRDIPPRNRGA